MRMMLEEDVVQYAGPKGKHDTTGRIGYRHGHERTTVVMGGEKIYTERPRDEMPMVKVSWCYPR